MTDAGRLCRSAGHTCAACCYGAGVSESGLTARLRRQTRLFRRLRPTRLLGRVWFEVVARRGSPLWLAPLFVLPGVGPFLRGRFHRRGCCAFLGFDDAAETRVGCLIHPSQVGREVRRSAFALLPGVRCGEPGYRCPTATLYERSPVEGRRAFRERTRAAGWFAFGAAVRRGLSGFSSRSGEPRSGRV